MTTDDYRSYLLQLWRAEDEKGCWRTGARGTPRQIAAEGTPRCVPALPPGNTPLGTDLTFSSAWARSQPHSQPRKFTRPSLRFIFFSFH